MTQLYLNPTKLTLSHALSIEPMKFHQTGPTFKEILFIYDKFFQAISIHSFLLTMY